MNPQELFVTRLRRHRQRNRLTVDEIAAQIRVKPELLEALEQNDLSAWPRGIYARAWIRAYASAVGLDPIDAVDEFCRLFPHGDRRAGGTIQEIAAIVAAPSEYRDEFAHEDRRRKPAAPVEPAGAVAWAAPPQINVMPKPAWHAPIVQASRQLWLRVATMSNQLRARRAPRTSM